MRDFRDVTTATTCISIHDMPKMLEKHRVLRGSGLGILRMRGRKTQYYFIPILSLIHNTPNIFYCRDGRVRNSESKHDDILYRWTWYGVDCRNPALPVNPYDRLQSCQNQRTDRNIVIEQRL
jgi:hypothetical protein